MLLKKKTDAFRIGPVKLYIDGSIISRTSPIGWPGYWDGSPPEVITSAGFLQLPWITVASTVAEGIFEFPKIFERTVGI